ncbi:hypothetical protein [Vogesella mureinivorans]|nr:hypothetical protein [Vogesella mureinivorans]
MADFHGRWLATPDAAVPYPGYAFAYQGWPRYTPRQRGSRCSASSS